jgi:hypothetical protein
MNTKAEGHIEAYIEVSIVIPTIQEEQTKPQMINTMI